MKLYGRNCIVERLKKNPKSIKNIFIETGVDIDELLIASVKNNHIPVESITKNDFHRKSQGIPSQGIIAEVEEFKYVYLEDILRKKDILLFLDNLNDPQNLGSILRTAACFGGFAVVLPKHDSVEVTEAVLRVAQGGENYVPIAKVTNLAIAIEKAKKAEYWIAGTVTSGGENAASVKLNFPLGIVIGSEGKGIRQGLISHLDFKLTLPMAGADLSFNASVAAALFCYESVRQRLSS